MFNFQIDLNQPTTEFPHFWELCVGSCHAYTALRADYQQQLIRAHRDCGFEYVRFHGLLNDDMSVVVQNQRTGTLHYNFFNIDTIIDFLLSTGMKPFLELGFMPTPLASTATTCFHYKGNVSLPKSYDQWATLIGTLTRHLVDRYGLEEVKSWFFEVWNEPNLPFFFEGTQADYFKLYESAARAIKEVSKELRVGGPATSINAWLPDMIRFCEGNGVPLDFLSTHHYPSDDPLWRDDKLEMNAFIEMVMEHGHAVYQRGVLQEMTKRAHDEAGSYPLYYTEWNTSAMSPEAIHDEPYSAALMVKSILDNRGLVKAYSFWTFTDIFEEGGQQTGEFHGGFGLQTVHGVAKPTYRAFQLLHELGDELYPVAEEQDTVGLVATKRGNELVLLAYNHQIQEEPIAEQTVSIRFTGIVPSSAEMICVDEQNANAYRVWNEMGSPLYPTSAQLEQLHEASALVSVPLQLTKDDHGYTIEATLMPHSVALFRVRESV